MANFTILNTAIGSSSYFSQEQVFDWANKSIVDVVDRYVAVGQDLIREQYFTIDLGYIPNMGNNLYERFYGNLNLNVLPFNLSSIQAGSAINSIYIIDGGGQVYDAVNGLNIVINRTIRQIGSGFQPNEVPLTADVFSGNDKIIGKSQAILYGFDGNDTISGGDGSDELHGGSGNDTLNGGGGSNYLYGENGDDTIVKYFTNNSVGDYLIDGGSDFDTWLIRDDQNYLTGNMPRQIDVRNELLVNMEAVKINFGNFIFNSNQIGGTSSIQTIIGDGSSPWTDTITVTAPDVLSTTGAIINLTSVNFIDWKTSDNIIIEGSLGNDTLYGSSVDDHINGSDGNDTIRALQGKNIIDGGNGIDTIDYSFVQFPTNSLYSNVYINLNKATPDPYANPNTPNILFNGFVSFTTNYGPNQVSHPVYIALDQISNVENVNGSNYDDTIIGDGGDNVLKGGTGNDTIWGLVGHNTIDGGDGIDTVRYDDIPVNSGITPLGVSINLSTNNAIFWGDSIIYNWGVSIPNPTVIAQDIITNVENVIGSNYNDIITGDVGNNVLNGKSGDDILMGLEGNNIIDGGDGTDTVDYNFLVNSKGNPVSVYVNLATTVDINDPNNFSYNSIVQFSVSSDLTLYDPITGQPYTVKTFLPVVVARDKIINVENVNGSMYDDTLIGNAKSNILNGGAGNDTLDSGVSDAYNPGVIDSLNGGDGNDTFLVRGFYGAGVYDGGTGIDTLDFSQPDVFTNGIRNTNGAGVSVNLATNKAFTYYATATGIWTDANGQITVTNIENVISTNQNDLLCGDNSVNTLDSGAGNDTLYGAGGLDVLKGGAGNDTYYIGYGDDHTNKIFDTIIEDVGDAAGKNDLVYAFLTGYTLADNVETLQLMGDAVSGTGNAGNNTLIGNALSNSLDGGAGNDTLDGGVSDTYNPGIIDTLNGGAGDDTFLVRGFFGAGVYDGGTGIDTIDFSQPDTYTAGLRAGSVGVNVDLSANKASTYYLAASSYTWADPDGQITLTNIENVTGSSQSDLIIGDANANILDGGTSDTYNPGVIDSLKGGLGDDTFLVRGFFGAGVYDGGTGIDAIDFSQPDAYTAGLRAGGVGVNVNLATNKASTYYLSASNYTWADPNGQITVSNIENVIGTNQNDLLYGDNNVNSLDGGAGNDTLYGAGGLDVLKGGAGNDTYYIGYGDDHTNKIFDTIIEDVGDAAGKNDLVYAFLTGYTLADNVETLQLMGDAVSGTGNAGNNTLIGNALSNSLDGGAGNDTLDGGVSDTYNPGIIDTLNGGAGDDTFLVRGFFGAGVYDGGTGIDTIDFSQPDTYTAGLRAGSVGVNVDLSANKASTYYLAASSYTWADPDGQITLTNIENVTGSSQSDLIIGDANANILDGGTSDTYNPGVIDSLKGGLGDDTFLVRGFFGAGVYDGGTGIDTIDFSQPDAYTAGLRAGGVGVNVNLATNKASTYYLSASNYTWADPNGQISVTNIENVIGSNQNDLLYGDASANSLVGGAGNDTLIGGEGADTLVGGLGKDTINLVETVASTDTVSIATGDSLITSYDLVKGLGLGTGSIISTGVDNLHLATTLIAANGMVDGTDVGNGANAISSHSITDGIISFDSLGAYDTAVSITAATNLANVFSYLQANIKGGNTVAFVSEGNTFVYQDGGSPATDTLVELVGVMAHSVSTSGLIAGAVWIA